MLNNTACTCHNYLVPTSALVGSDAVPNTLPTLLVIGQFQQVHLLYLKTNNFSNKYFLQLLSVVIFSVGSLFIIIIK